MDHSVEKHIYRLNCLCRVCAKRSSNKNSKPVKCDKHQKALLEHYQIDLTKDNELKHSSVMCRSCELRLIRCMKGKPLPEGFESELKFSDTIWSDFSENRSYSCKFLWLHILDVTLKKNKQIRYVGQCVLFF